jgi:hypothetical protein
MKIRRSVGELIQGIEAGYIPEERQFKNLSVGNPDDTITPGLTGNAWFTSSQLERSSTPWRERRDSNSRPPA